ncbi:MAG: ABC transporter permease [Ilumatobacteraceae bacterium]
MGGRSAVSDTVETPFRRFRRRFLRQRPAVVALVFLVGLVLVAVFAPVVAPHDPLVQDLRNTLQGPSSEHWLGTDELGRDVLSRMIFGSRVSLLAAVQAVVLALALGVLPGLVAGYFGGLVDTAISRLTDTLMSFPPLLLAIAIVGVFGPNLRNAMIAVGIIFAPRFIRLTRASVLAVKEETFVEASRSIGTPTMRPADRASCPTPCRRWWCRRRCRSGSPCWPRPASASSAWGSSRPTPRGAMVVAPTGS